MKKLIYLLTAFFLFLQACATVNIASNKQAGYTKKPKKIFIVASSAKEGQLFCNALAKGLQNNFVQRGVATQIYVRNALLFDTEEDINKKINTYAPEAVLQITQTERGAGSGTYELTLVDTETKKNVWKGELTTSSTNDSFIFEKGVNTVVNKLAQDGVI